MCASPPALHVRPGLYASGLGRWCAQLQQPGERDGPGITLGLEMCQVGLGRFYAIAEGVHGYPSEYNSPGARILPGPATCQHRHPAARTTALTTMGQRLASLE
jgi:hypothetical protein